MSYVQTLYHIVFRTYRSVPAIDTDYERELYAVILEQTKSLGGTLIRIGGMPDHLHILVSLPSSISLASYVQSVKTFSSKWLHANPHFPHFHGWSREYAGFTYAFRDKDMIANYIRNQKEHHKRTSFAEEYRAFILENGLPLREEFFMKDN
ncbi:MAG: transposase [Bacteroidales bacterium]|nr:transposase [Bacteroidales bacterium]